ncbi:low affinity immunoglobulin gamma Fc region receptor II-like [Huso huso]
MRRELFLVIFMSAVTQFGALEGLAPQPVLTLQAGWPEIFVGESVTLRCEIARQAGGWRYSWYRDGIPVRETYSDRLDGANYTIRDASRYHSGDYTCRVDRSSSPAHQSLCSDPVKILVSTGLVILQAPLMPLTRGEGVTLQCCVRGNPSLSQVLFYKDDKVIAAQASPVLTMARLTEGDEGNYWCRATWGRQWRWRSARSLEVPLSVTDPVEEDYESGYRPGPTDSTAHSIHTDHSLPDSPSLSHPSLPDTSNPTAHSLPDSPSLSHPSLPDTSNPDNPTAHSLPDSPSLSHPSLPDTSNPTAHSLPDSPSLSHPSLPDTSNPTAHSLPDSPSLSHPSLPDTSNPTAHSLPDSPVSHPSLPDTSNPTAHSLPPPDSPSLSPLSP